MGMFSTGTWQKSCTCPRAKAPSCSAPLELYSQKGFVCRMLTTSTITRPIAPGGAGFCFVKVPLLPVSQDKHWSSVCKEGKDGAGTAIPLAEWWSLMFAVSLICFYLLLVAAAACHYILFPYWIFCFVVKSKQMQSGILTQFSLT